MRHWSEDEVARTVEVFAYDHGMRGFRLSTEGVGPDAVAVFQGEPVEFEFKAAAVKVRDASQSNGERAGRFRIDPGQHDTYGTERLWYVLISYEPDDHGRGEVVSVRFVRSDYLPKRETMISLSAHLDVTESKEDSDE